MFHRLNSFKYHTILATNFLLFFVYHFSTVCLRMFSGYNYKTDLGSAQQYAMSFGYNTKTLCNPGSVRQCAMAPRPRFGEFDRFSQLYPEDILRHTINLCLLQSYLRKTHTGNPWIHIRKGEFENIKIDWKQELFYGLFCFLFTKFSIF